jgi:transcriptional regulator with PAS, ATPase and Fis domain
MQQVYQLLDLIAPSRLSVLVLGETGVGKEVFAETVHARSPRHAAPLVKLNCAALPDTLLEAELFGYERGAFTGATQAKPGLFEAGDKGTVFLDEVGELPLATQAKLLRVLETGEVLRLGSLKPRRADIRFVSATNRALEALVAEQRFRQDLYFRLNGFAVTIPPLRERPADLGELVRHFAAEVCRASGRVECAVSDGALDVFRAHAWPGNIRELRNVMERAVLLCAGASSLDAKQARAALGSGLGLDASEDDQNRDASGAAGSLRSGLKALEKKQIEDALERCEGNQRRAAEVLGIARRTLIGKLDEHGIARPRKRP